MHCDLSCGTVGSPEGSPRERGSSTDENIVELAGIELRCVISFMDLLGSLLRVLHGRDGSSEANVVVNGSW